MIKIPHPSAIVSLLIVAFAFALSIAAFAVSTIVAQHDHDSALTDTQRALNGNQAMIFAVCNSLRRRDTFMQGRLDSIKSVDLKYAHSAHELSPIERKLFYERMEIAIKNDDAERKQFVEFDCIKGMERAYDQGYRNFNAPTGKPLPTYQAFEAKKK
jgi:hypothetical protein